MFSEKLQGDGEIGEHLIPPEEYVCRRCGRDVGYRANLLVDSGVPDSLRCQHCGNRQTFLEGRDDVRKNLQYVNAHVRYEAYQRGRVYKRQSGPSKFSCIGCGRPVPLQPKSLRPVLAPDRVECPHCGQWQHFPHRHREQWASGSCSRLTALMAPAFLILVLTVLCVSGLGVGWFVMTFPIQVMLMVLFYFVLLDHLVRIDRTGVEDRRERKEPLEYSWTSRRSTYTSEQLCQPTVCMYCQQALPDHARGVLRWAWLAPDRVRCPHCGAWQETPGLLRVKWLRTEAMRLAILAAVVATWMLWDTLSRQDQDDPAKYAPLVVIGALMASATIWVLLRLALPAMNDLFRSVRALCGRVSEYAWDYDMPPRCVCGRRATPKAGRRWFVLSLPPAEVVCQQCGRCVPTDRRYRVAWIRRLLMSNGAMLVGVGWLALMAWQVRLWSDSPLAWYVGRPLQPAGLIVYVSLLALPTVIALRILRRRSIRRGWVTPLPVLAMLVFAESMDQLDSGWWGTLAINVACGSLMVLLVALAGAASVGWAISPLLERWFFERSHHSEPGQAPVAG